MWQRKPIEQQSIIMTLLNAVDILAGQLISVDLEAVKIQKGLAYLNGFHEPSFLNASEEENQSKCHISKGDRANFILKPEFFGRKPDVDMEIKREIITEEDAIVDRVVRGILS